MSTGSAALMGATTGASIGAIGGPVGAAVGAGLGAGIGALTTVGKNKYKKKNRQLLDADLEAMQNGELGLTAAEKRQATMDAMGAAGQQAGQVQGQIARDSLGATGQRDMGQYVKAQQAVGAQTANAGAQAAAQADAASRAQAEAKRQEIMARLEREQGLEARQNQLDEKAMAAAATDAQAYVGTLRSEYPEWFTAVV